MLILLLLPAWGIDRMFLFPLPRGRKRTALRVVLYVPNIVLSICFLFTGLFESYTAAADHWKASLLSVALLFVAPEVFFSLFAALGRLLALCFKGRAKLWTKRVLTSLGALLAATGFFIAFYGSFFGYRHVIVKEVRYVHSDIPAAFNGYRIVQLSDLHLGTLHGHEDVVQRIVDSVNACRPDLIVFTGDLVNYHAEEAEEFTNILRQMKARDGVVSIMGNHDYAQYYRWPSPADSLADIHRLQATQRSLGWDLLLNANHVIHRGADSIAIVGVENDGRPPFPSLGDLPRAQRGLSEGCFKILLSHDPTHWRRNVLGETTIPLMLAGHTHGMQFMIGSFSPAAWFYDEWGGKYVERGSHGARTLYISLGTGEVMLPFRFGAWPEVNVITLSSK